MALDREDIKFIESQNERLEKRLIEAIGGTATGVRAKIESEVNRIDEMDAVRNGIIAQNAKDICDLKHETRTSRLAQRNPKLAVILFIVSVTLIAFGYHAINFKRTVEKVLKIELNDEFDSDKI